MSSNSEWLGNLLREWSRRDHLQRREWLIQTYAATKHGEPEIGYLGRTWVTRSASYWVRRLALTFAYFLLACFIGSMFLGLGPYLLFSRGYSFNAHIPLIAKIALLVVWFAPAAAAYLMMYRSLVLYGYRKDRLLDEPAPTGFLAGRLLPLLAVPFLSIAGGLVVAMFTATLRAQFPGESAARAARRLYADEQRSRAAGRRTPSKKRRSGR
ncbi:hypothetical protein GXW83_08275 [Streptacidiphilus sp. PB12-B1b]|uniref:hypothetical protein n=1 Tax=Streptacidiphilus sp. PB12-B1b TaxID=2705012 RepID=UPI0015FCB21F|nr:hypothetical protein [Streptacidiphilus sp. PB12-B1b]QMU75736.1 hypothetical protein GXW83_08275 [Streptacidiphilus sp. PB12-B1b]